MSLFPDLHVAPFDASAFEEDVRRNLARLLELFGPMDVVLLATRYHRAHGSQTTTAAILLQLDELVMAGRVEATPGAEGVRWQLRSEA